MKTKLRRFYVAHPKIQDNHNTWTKSTLQEAIDHATELVEKTGQTQYIVKIIKVVSRAKPPIKVEDAMMEKLFHFAVGLFLLLTLIAFVILILNTH